MTATREDFTLLVRNILPLEVDEINRRATRHRNRRWAGRAAVAALLVTAVALPIAVLGGRSGHSVVIASQPGSPGMPSTFIVMRQGGNTNEVDVLDTYSGTVIRRLYDASPVDALATDANNVYLATPAGILRIPRNGGTPARLSSQTAQMMTVSPDGRYLAWAQNQWPGGAQNHHVSIVAFTVIDLQTRATRSWNLPPQSDLTPADAANPIYQVRSLAWLTDAQLAAITYSSRVLDNTFCTTPASGMTPPSNCSTEPGLAPPDPAHLLLIDTNSTAPPRTLNIPGSWFSFGHLSNPDLLVAGTSPNTLIAALYTDPNITNDGRLVEITLAGQSVKVKTLQSIRPSQQATSLDKNGQDLLLIESPATPPYKLTMLRQTNQQPPVQIGNPGTWYTAIW